MKKKITIIIIAVIAVVVALTGWRLYDYFSVKVSKAFLLLPESPLAYARINDIILIISRLQKTEFWSQFINSPIAKEIQNSQFWQNVQNTKSNLEYNIGQNLELSRFKEAFGQESIICLYRTPNGRDERSGGKLSWLLLTRISPSLKLRVFLLELKDLFDNRYRLSTQRHGGFKVVSVDSLGYKFSYALIGMTAVLSARPDLIKSVIDVYKGRANSFNILKLRDKSGWPKNDKNDKNELYLNLAQYPSELPFGNLIEKLSNSVSEWMATCSFNESTLTIEQFMTPRSTLNPQLSTLNPLSQTHTLSSIPIESPLISELSQLDSSTLWKFGKDIFGLGISDISEAGGIKNIKHVDVADLVEKGATISILAPQPGGVTILPQMLLVLKAKNKRVLVKTLTRLNSSLRIGRRSLKFETEEYKGFPINVAYIPLGLRGHLKGGYAFVGDQWLISTDIRALETAIDLSESLRRDGQLSAPRIKKINVNSILFIQVKLPELVVEARKLATFVTLNSIFSGEQSRADIAAKISENLVPFETLQQISFQVSEVGGLLKGELSIVKGSGKKIWEKDLGKELGKGIGERDLGG